MITSVRFCLSHDHFELDVVALKVDSFSTENEWLTSIVVMTAADLGLANVSEGTFSD